MIERHYDEEALVTMIGAGAPATDPHLHSCGECTGKLESFRLVTGALRDAATWDKRELDLGPNPNTVATLRAFASNIATEDAAAEAFVADLLAGGREGWMAKLAMHPEYRTAGTVRKLIAAASAAIDTMPADAVVIAELAVEIAEHLPADRYRDDTVARLCGTAWRERAYALFFVGNFAEADFALGRAVEPLSQCVVGEYELARTSIVQTLVDRGLERFDSAREAAVRSEAAFMEFGDAQRLASARLAQVHVRYAAGDFTGAMEMLLDLDRRVQKLDAAQTHALVLGNLGFCSLKLGRIADAIRYHDAAAAILDVLGMKGDSVRVRWTVAEILAAEGRLDEAMERFPAISRDFESLGMTGAATNAALELAELVVARGGSFEMVEDICRKAIRTLESAGLAHTERALTALSLLQECARKRTATPRLVKHVREYVRRLPEEPALLFAPLPD